MYWGPDSPTEKEDLPEVGCWTRKFSAISTWRSAIPPVAKLLYPNKSKRNTYAMRGKATRDRKRQLLSNLMKGKYVALKRTADDRREW